MTTCQTIQNPTETQSVNAAPRSALVFLLALLLSVLTGCFQITEYDYEGQNFESFFDANAPDGEYTTDDFVTATIVLDQPLESNLGADDDLVDILDRIVMYAFEDGRQTLDEGNSRIIDAAVATDGNGNIVFWDFQVSNANVNAVTGVIRVRNDVAAAFDSAQLLEFPTGDVGTANDAGDWIRLDD